jgi:glycosyltransferase involved in cell wall biosynthesis
MTGAAVKPGPIRVVFVDADDQLPEISPVRADGGTYEKAWVFAACGGRLKGELEIDLDGRVMPAGELAVGLRDALGEQWSTADECAPAVPDDWLPFISVVIATTMERVDHLELCLASIAALDYPAFEVIVVDNRPDESAERAALHARLCRDSRIRVVTESRVGTSAARNRGARLARADIVAFTDDDVVVHGGWLRGIGARFAAEPDIDCVSGVVLPAELETPAQIWFERSGSKLEPSYRAISFHNDGTWRRRRLGWLRRERFEMTATPVGGQPEKFLLYRAGKCGMGANIAFRHAALRSLGWFDETLGPGTAALGAEDTSAIARLLYQGGRVILDPGAVVRHHHRLDYAGSRRQMYGYGVGATAALAAMVRSDPRHLIGLLHLVLPGLRLFLGKSSGGRSASDYPQDLARVEMRGLVVGPFAYLRSLLAHARAVRRMGVAARTP